jgi:hypothetical protein
MKFHNPFTEEDFNRFIDSNETIEDIVNESHEDVKTSLAYHQSAHHSDHEKALFKEIQYYKGILNKGTAEDRANAAEKLRKLEEMSDVQTKDSYHKARAALNKHKNIANNVAKVAHESIEDIVYENADHDADSEEGLEAEEHKFELYEKSAKGKKKKSYDKKIAELKEKEKAIKESLEIDTSKPVSVQANEIKRYLRHLKNTIGDMHNDGPISNSDQDKDKHKKDIAKYKKEYNMYLEKLNTLKPKVANESIEDIVNESELTTEERKELDVKEFGLPKERKFPIHDEKHVSSAITYFHTASPSKRKELAANINKQAKKLGMKIKVSQDNEFHKHADEAILQ